MKEELYKDPQYNNLERLMLGGSCVVFLGSGLSNTLYPSWEELIARLCAECGVVDSNPTGSLDAETLLELAEKARQRDERAYCRVLKETFGRPVVDTRRAYDLLMRLPFRRYITTNFDPLLEREGRKPEHGCRLYTFPDLPVGKDDGTRSLYYIHGRIKEGDEPTAGDVILCRSDFDRAYGDEHGTLKSFLHQVVTYEPLVFIGCGLREPPLIRVFEMCSKTRKAIEQSRPGHKARERYALRPRLVRKVGNQPYGPDIDRERTESNRFQELGVTVVRYHPIDEKHSAIEEILDGLCRLSPLPVSTGLTEGGLT